MVPEDHPLAGSKVFPAKALAAETFIQPEEGSDYYWLRRGYMTCTFLGDFNDYNRECGETLKPFTEPEK